MTVPALLAPHTGTHRARRRFWYEFPMPLAVLLAMIMPWVAVRDIRSRTRAFVTLCDITMAAWKRGQLGQPKPPPTPRGRGTCTP